MNRRSFLASLGALVGGIALDKAIPLGRVWSFPKEIKPVNFAQFVADTDLVGATALNPISHLATVYYNKKALDALKKNLTFFYLAEGRSLPMHTGKSIQFHRYASH